MTKFAEHEMHKHIIQFWIDDRGGLMHVLCEVSDGQAGQEIMRSKVLGEVLQVAKQKRKDADPNYAAYCEEQNQLEAERQAAILASK